METKKSDPDNIYQIVRGIPFQNTKLFVRKNIEDAMDYAPKDGDVIITSYPKTGSTWIQYILMQVVSKATLFSNLEDAMFKLYPHLEMVGVATVEALAEPRIYKCHLPYNMVQKNEKSKRIYTYRHPEDTLLSFYHFFQDLFPKYTFGVDEFLDNFLSGKIDYGGYFKHVLAFYEHRDDPNLLMVSYEKLHANRRDEILRIAKFLGEEHYTCLVENKAILDKIMEHTSFEYMKKNLHFAIPAEKKGGEGTDVNFFRKGIIGDGKNALTEEQRECMKTAAKTILRETSIIQEWYPEEN